MAASTDASASTTPSRTRGKAAASASTSTAAAPRKRNLTGDSAQSPSRNSKRLKRDTAANSDDDEADGSDASESGEVNAPPTVSSLTTLPPDVLQVHLPRQRSAVLHRLAGHVRSPSQLTGLSEQSAALSVTLTSTVKRGESNSILLVGGKGSGKSALLDATLAGMPHGSYHHVRISALQCTTDRSAMRELARQLIQTGALGLDAEQQLGMAQGDGDGDGDGDEDEGHDADGDDASQDGGSDEGSDAGDDVDADADADEKAALGTAVLSSLSSTTSSILSLLASTPTSRTSAKPLVITLDHFDLLTARPRQALLYCLLDAVQSGTYQPGLAVVGMTRRVDTTDLLEKRVKSRFSHRIVQFYPPASEDEWRGLVRNVLTQPQGKDTGSDADSSSPSSSSSSSSFSSAWTADVDALVASPQFTRILTTTTELSHDVQHLFAILYPVILSLSPLQPSPNVPELYAAAQNSLRDDAIIQQLYDLPTMAFLLVIASKQLQLRDRVVFNFEVAFDEVVGFAKRSRRERQGVGTGGVGLVSIDGGGGRGDGNGNGNEALSAAPSTPSRRTNRGLAAATPTSAGRGAVTTASATSFASPWEDRRRAMMAFEQLLALEIFLPDAFLATLSAGPSTTTTAPLTSTSSTAAAHSLRTSNTAGNTAVRKEYLRVRSVLNAYVVVQIAKDRAAKGTLGTEVAQWASRSLA